ncbi:MAG: glucose-6-phosphate isomerase [Treponema sp.]
MWKDLDTCKSFAQLQKLPQPDIAALLSAADADKRVANYAVPMPNNMLYNYAAKHVDAAILQELQHLADEQQVIEKYKAVLNGEHINTGENRKVLHHLARGQLGNDVVYNGKNMRVFYLEQLKNIRAFSDSIHAHTITASSGKPFTDVVQIGIGGSDLGPRALYIALKSWAETQNTLKLKAHFISNVDPDDASEVLSSLNLATTLFILVSKSGTTLETLTNECFVKQFLEKAGLDPAKQMIAVTSETSPLANNPAYLASFYMDDFIGGRYSSSSACGAVVLSLAFGADVFEMFLQGAAAADAQALETDILKNPALLDALIGVYERNVLGFGSTAVLPYAQALSRFPAHLQQLDMESNGKTVNRDGQPISYKTGPVIFGEPGTNGQHSFYQLLHQGADIIPLQFIGFKENQRKEDITVEGSTSQQKLLANVVAQIAAFACGKTDSNANKHFSGGRPSSIICGEALTPASMGTLLAHFENKVMFQGFIWNVNSFDQEGVQLGKLLAKKVLTDDMSPALAAYARLFGL